MRILLPLLLIGALFACDPVRLYEKNQDLEEYQWYIDTIPTFQFEVKDVSVPYNIYYNIRNAAAYPYYNLYITYYLSDNTGKILTSRLQELTLMDPQTGKPLGDGMGDIFDHRILSVGNYRFPRPGTYTFKVKQYMRKDPLPGIMSVGVRVEQAGGKTE
ncbi:MAG: gliding motility lipoprotein GldH [Cytophagales bacterium]|nr:gliding motility lipoprotein GldH [Cytophagales bacterium]